MGNSIDAPMQERECRVVVLGKKSGDNALLELCHLPKGARIVAHGENVGDLHAEGYLHEQGNVLLNTGVYSSKIIADIISEMPLLQWIHTLNAGIDNLLCDAVTRGTFVVTNAKGMYSSSLAEYNMNAILHFNKQVTRLNENKQKKEYERFIMKEIRGLTLGIVGYGDIGKACAKVAKPFGMNVIGLRRRPEMSAEDEYIDECYGLDKLHDLMAESDYLLVVAALTKETRGMINAEALSKSKEGQIVINLGRGPIIDEPALVEALENGPIGGAALDVFTIEPLPEDSKLWTLPNVLLSPHNADMTADFRQQSVRFFCQNCEKWLAGDPLVNIVDPKRGY
jgi:phosphoglycerate dehydrogenase-like enzyme